MLKLSNYISLKTIKKSPKLQEVFKNNTNFIYPNGRDCLHDGYICEKGDMPAPTIVDVIDNAEKLFDDIIVCGNCGKTECWSDVDGFFCSHPQRAIRKINYIFIMCQQNKSLKDIEKYIIQNLK